MTLDLAPVGLDVEHADRVGGGDSATAWRARLTDGRTVFVKRSIRPTPGMLPLEAAGLAWLTQQGAATPSVVAVADDILVLDWIERTKPTAETAEAIGTMLATLHSGTAPAFGSPPPDAASATRGWVGTVEVPFADHGSWPQFYVAARIQPAARAARHLGGLTTSMSHAIDDLCEALLSDPHRVAGPDIAPSVTHGDLWSGNLMWTDAGGVLVDPAAVGGHPETDLAMLQLFGAPQWTRIVSAYQDVRPLPDGWRERVALHQVFPLLVHAAMFGAGYGAQAAEAARAAAAR